MKRSLLVSLILIISGLAQAQSQGEKFTLHYRFMDKHLVEDVVTGSFDEAIEVGSQKCLKFYFSHFKMSQLSPAQKQALANTCTNPRKS